jgi:hypothetical protein
LTTTTRLDLYWEKTNDNGTVPGHEDAAPFDDNIWASNGGEHAFQLFDATPEPGTLALTGLGMLGLVGWMRRRKKQI